jgi:hypothetical protein
MKIRKAMKKVPMYPGAVLTNLFSNSIMKMYGLIILHMMAGGDMILYLN